MSRKLWVASVVAVSLAIVAVVADRSRSQEQGEERPTETSAVATDQVKPTPLPAPEKPRIWATEDPEGTERLYQMLKSDVVSSLNFPDGTSLEEVLTYLTDEHGQTFLLDTTALDESGLGPDEPIVISVKNVRLGQALRLMLEPLHLTYCVDNGVIVITTEEDAFAKLPTAVYDVRDLLLVSDYDSLIDSVTSVIANDTWAKNGGGEAEIKAYPQRGSLVVSHSTRIHEEILTFFTALRDAPFDPEAKTLPKDCGCGRCGRGGGAFHGPRYGIASRRMTNPRSTAIDLSAHAEAFRARYVRLLITAADGHWLAAAVNALCGYGASVIGCDCEIAVERPLATSETPDGRPGAAVLAFGFKTAPLGKAVAKRVGQTILTCPTAAAFDGLPGEADRAPPRRLPTLLR